MESIPERERCFSQHHPAYKLEHDLPLLEQRGSTIVTTNPAFSHWTELFENAVMAVALVDRLTFKSYVLDIFGDSCRLEQPMKVHG